MASKNIKANKVVCLRHRKVKCSVIVSRKRNRRQI